ncbi:PilZ domain-containing protein [Desulfolithobacter sp.]
MITEERRQATRIRFESRVRIHWDNGELEATADTRDISLKGLYVFAEKRLPVGTRCSLDIDLTGPASKLICSLTGVICRHDASGMGIQFQEMDPHAFVHLKSFLHLKEELVLE